MPAWLDTAHPRVTVVSHREVFGEAGRLPTFNSHAVESRLHHIPGLAEHFLYLHDDMFLGRTLPPTAFFHANGVAKFFASPVGFGLGQASAATGLDVAAGRNGAEMIAQRYGRTITAGTVQAPYPCQRSVLEEIESNSAARMEATASHRFRDRGDLAVLSSMQHHWAFMQARAVPGQIQREYVDTARPIAAVALSRLLRRRDADVFCLDDTGGDGPQRDEQRAMLGDFLAAYFPFRAPWERVAERVTEVITPSARRPAPVEERPEQERPEQERLKQEQSPEREQEPDEEPVGQASFAQRMISPLTRSGASWWRKWPAVGTRRHRRGRSRTARIRVRWTAAWRCRGRRAVGGSAPPPAPEAGAGSGARAVAARCARPSGTPRGRRTRSAGSGTRSGRPASTPRTPGIRPSPGHPTAAAGRPTSAASLRVSTCSYRGIWNLSTGIEAAS